MERKSTENSKRIHCKKVTAVSNEGRSWGRSQQTQREGEQSQQPMTTLEDKGRHTNGHNTPGCTESRGQEIVETMPLPTKLKAK